LTIYLLSQHDCCQAAAASQISPNEASERGGGSSTESQESVEYHALSASLSEEKEREASPATLEIVASDSTLTSSDSLTSKETAHDKDIPQDEEEDEPNKMRNTYPRALNKSTKNDAGGNENDASGTDDTHTH